MKKILLSMILSVSISTASYAASVDTFGIGPKATALGGAVTAQSNDVYSIYYNPAGLTDLKGGQFSMAIQMCDPTLKFHDYTVTNGTSELPGSGGNIRDDADNLFIPFMGYAQPINDKLAAGVAAYVPFGLDIKWDKTTLGADNWFHSYYIREVVSPTLSYKINDKISVGAGVALGKSKSGAEKYLNYPLAASTAMPTVAAAATTNFGVNIDDYSATNKTIVQNIVYAGRIAAGDSTTVATATAVATANTYEKLARTHAVDNQKLELELEDSFNYSANAGIKYAPNDKVAVGLTFRGRAEADFDGDVTINGVKVSTADMSYDHPEQIQIGVMVKPVSDVTLEMDVVWTNWSINKTQITKFSPYLMNILPYEELERDWNDTNQVRLGAEWQVNKLLALRCGYFYDPTPVPDDTFDIMWPDADRKTYSIGAGLNFGKWTVDGSIQFAHAETKRIIGGESDNLNESYNPYSEPGTAGYYHVETSADGFLMGYGLALTYNF